MDYTIHMGTEKMTKLIPSIVILPILILLIGYFVTVMPGFLAPIAVVFMFILFGVFIAAIRRP